MRFVRFARAGVTAVALLSCKSVEPRQITVTVSPETVSLAAGATQQLTATVGGTDNTDVTWTTSSSSVATVSATGLVTGVGAGTATITATSDEDTDVFADVLVAVTSSGTGVTSLTSGVAVTGISGASGSNRHYLITVPAGATQLSVSTTGGTGDMDLYVNFGAQATATNADCDSESASTAESCVISNPAAGEWYIMLLGYTAYSGVSLTATVTGGSGGTPTSGFTIANSTSSPSVARGSSTTMTVTATRAGSFTGAIDLTVTGLPSGVTASFNPATLSSSQTSSTLTLTASAGATTGSSTITVRGNATGQTERTATATLTVNATAGSSAIVLSPSTTSITIGRGQAGWMAFHTAGTNYSGTGTLAAENVGTGLTAEWLTGDDATPSASGFFTANDYAERLRITASASAPLGTSSFTVRATPGNTSVPQVTTTIQVTIVEPQAAGNAAWTQLFLGSGISCGRRANQKTYCWGGLGHNGDGAAGMVRVPSITGMGRPYTSATYGGTWGCGIDAGAAYCWGTNNGFGFLGNGQASGNEFMPVAVSGGHTFSSITAAPSHTCALTPAGAAWCWGAQFGGQLGDGVIATTNGDFRTTPTQVLGGITFASISAGGNHNCGLTAAGVAWCWGSNQFGQLGDGTKTNRAQPVQVSGGLTFASISSGERHTCALTANGTGYCWGAFQYVGDPNGFTDKTAPAVIPGGMQFSQISAGESHSCAITTAGAAYCWGGNFYGQIGNGASGSSTTVRPPTAVSGGHTFSRIAAGDNVSCGVTTANALYCWGYNNYGLLGDGTTTNRSTPTLVKTF
jgi:alpha-tubulin suppressor-like RCC1 family protein